LVRLWLSYALDSEAGAPGFRDFPGLPAEKENRNGIGRTLHAPFPNLSGQEGFQRIGEHPKDDILNRYFLAESLKRAQFRGELETMLHAEGDHDPKESGSVGGAIHRTWGDIKAHLGGGDHMLLETAEQGEDAAKKAYRDALEKGTASAR
jgi:uncharacterized protein (TIGR02284 family)